MLKQIFIFLFLSAVINNNCYAQYGHEEYEFAPGEKVIFADDFAHDTVGAFPSHWHIAPCNKFNAPDYTDKKFWKVQKHGSEHALLITTTTRYIDPNMPIKYYLHDSFAVEFDYTFDTGIGCAELLFYTYENPDSCIKGCLHLVSSGQVRISDFPGHPENVLLAEYPVPFNHKAWHHFAFAYRKKAVDIYIDNHRLVSIEDCQFTPYGVSLGCIAPVRYEHFRITTGKDNTFNAIITKKKFVTHAIHFDVNKSVIKEESMQFVLGLAQFLKENPKINLEVVGHTDSDGDSLANMKLSLERALAVKNKLVSMGINAARLTTKGLGSSEPLQPNTTEAGKAYNRRVEFIKM